MGRRTQAERVLAALSETIDSPTTELAHEDPYQLLVSVILSAQCTDERVNRVTPALFEAFPDIGTLADAAPDDVLPYIASITFPNNKTKHLVGMARRVRDRFGGEIPEGVEALRSLPGVGRKTALVVSAVAHGEDTLAVDTHVFRVSHRLGLVRGDARTPEAVERQLRRVIPRSRWSDAHHYLILHGRYTCTARSPTCSDCPAAGFCPFRAALDALPDPVEGLDSGRGAYWCATRRHYFDRPDVRTDRNGRERLACPRCGSMNIFESRTGTTLKRVPDPRADDPLKTTGQT